MLELTKTYTFKINQGAQQDLVVMSTCEASATAKARAKLCLKYGDKGESMLMELVE